MGMGIKTKIPVYDVQTFFGAYAKTFQWKHHAEEYHEKLLKENECVDPIRTRYLTQEEFIYENIDD